VEIIHSAQPVYIILTPLVAVLLIGLSRGSPNLRECWTLMASVIKFSLVASMIPVVLDGNVIESSRLTVLPGLDVSFRVDALGTLFAVTAAFLWIVTSVYSIG